ncbi:MAG: NUDIX domain-containing protein [Elusimicrobia bacterium]|nr:NUDIX domain-containing protein [Elusimicrobiota bacterium]
MSKNKSLENSQLATRLPTGQAGNSQLKKEFSCGGVVSQDGKVLVVNVKNLKGQKVWTFPKGHLEEGETSRDTALREVEEETGYRCRILKSLFVARYFFRRGEETVQKKVQWFWMEPGRRVGRPDVSEIFGVRWVSFRKAEQMLQYPSDHQLLREVIKLAGGT